MKSLPDPPPEEKKIDGHIERMKRIAEIERMRSTIPPPPPSLTDMFGGPTITTQLAPILSGVSKLIATMPTKTKLEGNINGGNFSIEIVDKHTCDIAVMILTNIQTEYYKQKSELKSAAAAAKKKSN